MSTIVLTSNTEAALQQAINNAAKGDVIQFAQSSPGATVIVPMGTPLIIPTGAEITIDGIGNGVSPWQGLILRSSSFVAPDKDLGTTSPIIVQQGATITIEHTTIEGSQVVGDDGANGASGADGLDGESGSNAGPDGIAIGGFQGTPGGPGSPGEPGQDAMGGAIQNFGTVILDHTIVQGYAFGGNGGNGGSGGQGGDGGNGGAGKDGEAAGENGTKGAAGGPGGIGGEGAAGADGGDAVAGIYNAPGAVLTLRDSSINGASGAAGNGGLGGSGGFGGDGGNGGFGGSGAPNGGGPGGNGGNGGAAGDGANGGNASNGGNAGQSGGAFWNDAGTVNAVGAVLINAGSTGFGGQRGFGGDGGLTGDVGLGGPGGEGNPPGADGLPAVLTGVHSSDGTDGANGADAVNNPFLNLNGGVINGELTLQDQNVGLNNIFEIDTTRTNFPAATVELSHEITLSYFIGEAFTPRTGSVEWRIVTGNDGPLPDDFDALSGQVRFLMGNGGNLNVTIHPDPDAPRLESFTIELFNPLNGLNTTTPALLGTSSTYTQHLVNVLAARVNSDFNGDGMSDVLFSNEGAVFNSNYEWQLNNRSLLGQGAIDVYDKTFNVQIVGDYDGDDKSDVLFQNPTTGGVWEWRLDGTTILSQGAVDVADASFHLLGVGDLNADNKDDLLFRNDAGFVYEWQMNGRVNTPMPVGPLDPKWHVQDTGDFNGDGRDDILLHYKNSANVADPANGAFVVWQMNGSAIENTLGIERPDASWQTLGIGDFNGDGVDDLAIRNVSNSGDNGAVWVYLLAGTVTAHDDGSKTLNILAQGAAGIADPATWKLQEIGDLDGDGKDDVLYRNDAGTFYSWDMNGTTIASEGLLQGAAQHADPSFTVVKPHWDLV